MTEANLDLKDLAVALQLIEIAIQQGVYQPGELVTVGETHTKIKNFLAHQARLQAQAKEQQELDQSGENIE